MKNLFLIIFFISIINPVVSQKYYDSNDLKYYIDFSNRRANLKFEDYKINGPIEEIISYYGNRYTLIRGDSIHWLLQQSEKRNKYFLENLPKSLDRNYFHKYLKQLQAMDKTENIINSLLKIIPLSIEKLIFDTDPTIILCGGGRKNLTLQKLFRQHFKDVHSIDEYGLDGDYIESQGMALLSIRFLNKKKSTFTSTTGIKREVYLGERC